MGFSPSPQPSPLMGEGWGLPHQQVPEASMASLRRAVQSGLRRIAPAWCLRYMSTGSIRDIGAR